MKPVPLVPRLALLLAASLLAPPGDARALPLPPALQVAGAPGTPLLGDDPLAAAKLAGPAADRAEMSLVAVAGQPFARAVRVRTKARTTNEAAVKLVIPTRAPIQGGDTLFIGFWARTVGTQDETGQGRVRFTIDNRRPNPSGPPSAFFPQQATPSQAWERFDFPVTARYALAPGAGELSLRFGNTQPQIVEIGGLQVLRYGTAVRPDQLPHNKQTYEGREPDAPWRKEAAARIEKHRKGDLSVVVTDRGGKPLPGAAVHVRMRRHAYGFGSATADHFLAGIWDKPDGKRYREEFVKLFNKGAPENALKWKPWADGPGRQMGPRLVGWLRQNNVEVHAHALMWPGWRYSPKAAVAAKGDPAALRKIALDHIADIVGRFKGQVAEWDVLNEPRGNHEVTDVVGRDQMIAWFRAARKADPGAQLFINENANEAGGPNNDVYEKQIRYLLDGGAPLDGIGLQGHVGPISIPRFLGVLDRFAKLGLPLQITEFDIVTPDDALQGDFTRDFLTAVFSHPATESFTMWGFWDGAHWLGDAPIFYKDWTLKPSGEAYTDLVLKEWWTDAQGRTGAGGDYNTRGFLGAYEITVTAGGKTRTVQATLPKEGAAFTIVLDADPAPPTAGQASGQASPWEAAIQAFEAEDRDAPPPQGAILFVGSSSIRLWKTLAEDYPDRKVIRRGFGGSQLSDSVRFARRIILPYKPRQVVVYAGSNDIAAGKPPAQVLADFRALAETVRASLPETRLTYVSINPSVARWHLDDKMQETNRLIEAFTRTDPRLSYIDTHRVMLGPDGKPRADLLASDGLHLNAAGYKVWADAIRPHLLDTATPGP